MKKAIKLSVVIIGAVVITALGIDAADTMSGSEGTLLAQLIGSESGPCPSGMVIVPSGLSFSCVDMYEASPGKDCPNQNTGNLADSKANIQTKNCVPASKAETQPWSFVSRTEAETLCLRAGKRLPNVSEWHTAALGTIEQDCVIDAQSAARTGSSPDCRSAIGVFDTVGNVWEWVGDDVVSGVLSGRTLPPTGFVQSADRDGLAVTTGDTANEQYERDYFWSNPESVYAVMRGGFYGSGSDAGVQSVHADVPVDMLGEAIGFRCVL